MADFNEKNISEEEAKNALAQRDANFEKQNEVQQVKPDLGYVDLQAKRSTVPQIGWTTMRLDILPSHGKFYDDSMTINIRAANQEEIRHFSTMDDTDPIDINDKLNYILDKCSNISVNSKKASYKDLINVDKLFIVYSIRDLTFKHGENKLNMKIHCLNCGKEDEIEVGRSRLSFFQYDTRLDKYYDNVEKCFKIVTLSGETWNVYIPTIGINNFITNYSRQKMQQNQIPDKFFLLNGPFLFKDWRTLNEHTYKNAEQESFRWSQDKIDIMTQLVVMLEESIDTLIKHECSQCGSEVTAPLSFQGGFKSLFLNTNIWDKLG